MDENKITINVDELLHILSEIESVPVEFNDEDFKNDVSEINKNLNNYFEHLETQELTEEELLFVQEKEENRDNEILLINENLNNLNENVLALIESNENYIPNEMDELEVKANGSLILLFYITIAYLLVKTIYGLFNWFGNKI